VAFLRRRLAEEGVDIGSSDSQIVPIMVNNDARVLAVAEKMQERGLFLHPVTYPAVPKHKSRLRLAVSAAHSEEELETAVRVISGVLRGEGVCPS
jgi:glycine C-acetyltransferase